MSEKDQSESRQDAGSRIPIGFWQLGPGETTDDLAERMWGDIQARLAPRCDFALPGENEQGRCSEPAAVRVPVGRGEGAAPVCRERCLIHGAEDVGTPGTATWDQRRTQWIEDGQTT